MQQHSAAEGRKCWGTARERERLRARFLIRERVANPTSTTVTTTTTTISELSPSDVDTLEQFLCNILNGDRSKFSLSSLSKQSLLLSTSVPTVYLEESSLQRMQLCHAWFGLDYAQFLSDYIESLSTFSIMEYAVLLGKYSILGCLLVGGVNPGVRSLHKQDDCDDENDDKLPQQQQRLRLQHVGNLVLRRFFDSFPLPLSCYIVKKVVDMRINAYTHRKTNSPELCCPICKEHQIPISYQLKFSSCGHSFCEHCFWQDLLQHIDQRGGAEDVVLCPICGFSGFSTNGVDIDIDTPQQTQQQTTGADADESSSCCLTTTPFIRSKESLDNFFQLPVNRHALKCQPGKKKKLGEKMHIHSSWNAAVAPSLGLTQDVRRDKFFANVERNEMHYVRGCLVAGVDINWTNEYGQTALYLAAWRGNQDLVQLLLYYGADQSVKANGGSTVESVCKRKRHGAILEILEKQKQMAEADEGDYIHPLARVTHDETFSPAPILTTVIEKSMDHPGAGSYMVDDTISSHAVDKILELWKSLPPSDSHKKKGLCSVRTYYCDAEGYICELLSSAIERTNLASCTTNPATDIVFSHMRFLDYDAGIVLAPHVDLHRVEPFTGNRSTHSFLLYLSDCNMGGETALLGDLSGDGRNQVLANISPKRGRLLLFPHACPHEGKLTVDAPKILLRGEVMLSTTGK
jgi:hypothetical protein